MLRSIKPFVAACIALAVCVSGAQVTSAKAAKAKKVVSKLDTNGDGKVDAQEREAAKQAKLQRQEAARAQAKAKADAKRKTKPGTSNPTAGDTAARDAKRREIIAKYDANKDGKLDNVEAAKAMKELRGKKTPR